MDTGETFEYKYSYSGAQSWGQREAHRLALLGKWTDIFSSVFCTGFFP